MMVEITFLSGHIIQDITAELEKLIKLHIDYLVLMAGVELYKASLIGIRKKIANMLVGPKTEL